MNIIIHSRKPYRKWKTFTTYWYITIIREDVLNMLDRAAKQVDILLGYKVQKNDVKL